MLLYRNNSFLCPLDISLLPNYALMLWRTWTWLSKFIWLLSEHHFEELFNLKRCLEHKYLEKYGYLFVFYVYACKFYKFHFLITYVRQLKYLKDAFYLNCAFFCPCLFKILSLFCSLLLNLYFAKFRFCDITIVTVKTMFLYG